MKDEVTPFFSESNPRSIFGHLISHPPPSVSNFSSSRPSISSSFTLSSHLSFLFAASSSSYPEHVDQRITCQLSIPSHHSPPLLLRFLLLVLSSTCIFSSSVLLSSSLASNFLRPSNFHLFFSAFCLIFVNITFDVSSCLSFYISRPFFLLISPFLFLPLSFPPLYYQTLIIFSDAVCFSVPPPLHFQSLSSSIMYVCGSLLPSVLSPPRCYASNSKINIFLR